MSDLVPRLEGIRDELYAEYVIHPERSNLYLLYDRIRQIVEELKERQPVERT